MNETDRHNRDSIGANSIYCGSRTPDGGWIVTADARPIPLEQVIRAFGAEGSSLSWGYYGPGCFRTAYAILLHATRGNVITSFDLYTAYGTLVVARWPKTGFATSRAAVLRWIADRICPLPDPTTTNEGDRP